MSHSCKNCHGTGEATCPRCGGDGKIQNETCYYAEILTSKKKTYAEFRKVRDEAQELLIARQNLESFCEAETQEQQKSKKAEKVR